MNKKEKSRPRLQPGTGQAETAACGRAAISTSDCITTTANRQSGYGFISKLLSPGAGNGLTLRDLIALTGWREREIRAEIQRERLAGTPILSDNLSGYYLPANARELEQCVRSLRHRASEILKSAAAIERGVVSE